MQKSSIKYILKLSIPIFFANLAVPLVGIIDTSLMGNLEELSYLSATSIAANLFSMIFWSFGFLRMGTVGMVSNAFGQNNFQRDNKYSFKKFIICTLFIFIANNSSKLYTIIKFKNI